MTTPTFTGHLIFNAYGDLQRLTTNDTDAEMAAVEGLTVTTNAGVEEILSYLGPTPATEVMDDQTWQALAPALKHTADHQENPYDRSAPSIGATPLDIPDEVLGMFTTALCRIYDSYADLQAYVEINEVRSARQHNRQANLSLFAEHSLEASWDAQYEDSLDQLEEYAEAANEWAGEVSSQNASERAAYGDSAPGSYRAEVLSDLSARVSQYALEHYPEDKMSSGMSPG